MSSRRAAVAFLFLGLALHFAVPLDLQSGEHEQSHVVMPSANDHEAHSHGHHHPEGTPDHEHGALGNASIVCTVPARSAILPDQTLVSHTVAGGPELGSWLVASTSARASNLPPIRFDPPPRGSLNVLLI